MFLCVVAFESRELILFSCFGVVQRGVEGLL